MQWFKNFRSSHRETFLGKGVLKICSKFTGEHSCRNAISIKLLCNFIEITLRHGRSPVNLLHIFRTPFLKSTSGRLFVSLLYQWFHDFWWQNFQTSTPSSWDGNNLSTKERVVLWCKDVTLRITFISFNVTPKPCFGTQTRVKALSNVWNVATLKH